MTSDPHYAAQFATIAAAWRSRQCPACMEWGHVVGPHAADIGDTFAWCLHCRAGFELNPFGGAMGRLRSLLPCWLLPADFVGEFGDGREFDFAGRFNA